MSITFTVFNMVRNTKSFSVNVLKLTNSMQFRIHEMEVIKSIVSGTNFYLQFALSAFISEDLTTYITCTFSQPSK